MLILLAGIAALTTTLLLIRSAILSSRSRTEIIFDRIDQSIDEGNFDAALSLLERAVQDPPDATFSLALVKRARSLAETAQSSADTGSELAAASRSLVGELHARFPANPELSLLAAHELYRAGRPSAALRLLLRVRLSTASRALVALCAERIPGSPLMTHKRAASLLTEAGTASGMHALTLRAASLLASAAKPMWALSLLQDITLGARASLFASLLAAEQSRNREALSRLRGSGDSGPAAVEAQLLVALGDLAEAAEIYERIWHDESDPRALVNYAWTLAALDTEQGVAVARAVLADADRSAPGSPIVRLAEATYRFAQGAEETQLDYGLNGEHTSAADALRAAKISPLFGQRGYEAQLWRLVDAYPERCFSYLAWYLLRERRLSELDRALDLVESASRRNFYRGVLLAERDLWGAAAIAFEREWRLSRLFEAGYNAAIARVNVGGRDEASTILAALEALAPNSGGTARLRRLLESSLR